MKPHKHAELIKAWADGAEIECKQFPSGDWFIIETPNWYSDTEYRIKPQPKEPQYLYVYQDKNDLQLFINNGDVSPRSTEIYLGKIKLETEE